jgi:hypothetical protein
MPDPLVLDLFCEDQGHEDFLSGILQRLRREERVHFKIRPRSVRGGHGKALSELEQYLQDVQKQRQGSPDLLVVAIDANCKGSEAARQDIDGLVARYPGLYGCIAIACPDPHIERWYLADGEAFRAAVGEVPNVPPYKCERHYYKKALREAVIAAGQPTLLGGLEFAPDIAREVDFFRLGQADSAFKHFCDTLRNCLRLIHSRQEDLESYA